MTSVADVLEGDGPAGPHPDYNIEIANCNSIIKGQISLRHGALNIKYGPNGIGKSTIARALSLRGQGQEALAELTPFKYRRTGGSIPTVVGAEEITNVLVFDENYVSQFAFQRDEVLKDSFEIFINTPEYRRGIEEIEVIFGDLKSALIDDRKLDDALSSFEELKSAFGVTSAGRIAKTSRGFKAIAAGAKINHIPEALQGFQPFLTSDDPAGWITWQSKGKVYLGLSESCPFCATPSMDRERASSVSEEFESAAVKNMSALRSSVQRLGHYFESETVKQLNGLLTGLFTELSPEQNQFLANLRGDIETFLQKLSALRNLSFHVLRDEEDVSRLLKTLKINPTLLHSLDSESTKLLVEPINTRLDQVADQIDDIRRHIGTQKSRVTRLIRENQTGINDFLHSAGYSYKVRIEPVEETYRMILEHRDADGHLESAASHLSYGERNAFAMVLFMHHALSEEPDLVVLDDPVSSFDKTKKFAILHQLFHGRVSLRNLTTLLLTHDIEPAIDVVGIGTSGQFQAARPTVHFLSTRLGQVTEKVITKADLLTFSQVCDANIASSCDPIIKCIYLRRRYEVHGDRRDSYDLLSSLLHRRPHPTRKLADGEMELISAADVTSAVTEITEHIPGFDYQSLHRDICDLASMRSKYENTDIGYEKLQLFRIISELDPAGLGGDDTIKKFVNESFHIENEYVMQLNPREFDAVPEFLIQACNDLVRDTAD